MSRDHAREGVRNADLPSLFSPEVTYHVWIREWSWNQQDLSFPSWRMLGKLFNLSELHVFRSKNENICFLRWLWWWFCVTTCEKDYSTQHTFLSCVENPKCHLMHRENRVTEENGNEWEFIWVIMSNTGNISDHYIPHMFNNSGKTMSCSSYAKRFRPWISLPERSHWGILYFFYQKFRNESSAQH